MFDLDLLCSAADTSSGQLSGSAGGQAAPQRAPVKPEGGGLQNGTPAAAAPGTCSAMGTSDVASPLERKRWRAEADAALGLAPGASRW
jgi:hypothetical protein